jgi:hypothetical protein
VNQTQFFPEKSIFFLFQPQGFPYIKKSS